MANSFVADEQTAPAMAKAVLAWRFSQSTTILIYIIALAIAFVLGHNWFFEAFVVLALAFSEFWVYRKTVKTLANNIAKPGNHISVKLTAKELTIKTDQGMSKTASNFYKSLRVKGDHVLLKNQSNILIPLPKQVFSDKDLTNLQKAIQSSPKTS